MEVEQWLMEGGENQESSITPVKDLKGGGLPLTSRQMKSRLQS